MYTLVVDFMNFQAAVSESRNPKRVPLAPTSDRIQSDSRVERATPLCENEWRSFFNDDGRILNESALRKAIFKGGISSSIRSEVWMFLFGFYSFSSTSREREVITIEREVQYEVLKEKWNKEIENALDKDDERERFFNPAYCSKKDIDLNSDKRCLSVELQQQSMFAKIEAQINVNKKTINVSQMRHHLRTIDKDVPRTDRNLKFYQDPKNLVALRNILLTYVAFSPDIGYTQGMNDLVSRFHVVLKSEYKTYFCFLNFMERVEKEFLEDGMINKLELIRVLLKKMDPELYDFFDSLDVKEMLFCHRWLLLNFKREFDYEDSLRIFEIISSHHLELWSLEAEKERRHKRAEELRSEGYTHRHSFTVKSVVNPEFTFDLFVCLAILVSYRSELSKCADLSMIYNAVNCLSMNLNLDKMLAKAESLFLAYCRNSVVDCFQVVGLKE
ncbi:rab GTPase-activating protein 22-like [Xenia sp. Carnegie-2017]|uniref:rab GTPase-activating protein 22-like n=1 Tax=Xenia sp. Carnegie-2017 TaxID=2897299 RepID=UPI001F0426CC|nr:rab GTPase-activating protein 22-like [Xenia sp. Carnegie-2017]